MLWFEVFFFKTCFFCVNRWEMVSSDTVALLNQVPTFIQLWYQQQRQLTAVPKSESVTWRANMFDTDQHWLLFANMGFDLRSSIKKKVFDSQHQFFSKSYLFPSWFCITFMGACLGLTLLAPVDREIWRGPERPSKWQPRGGGSKSI